MTKLSLVFTFIRGVNMDKTENLEMSLVGIGGGSVQALTIWNRMVWWGGDLNFSNR